jgi:hypothetical protein
MAKPEKRASAANRLRSHERFHTIDADVSVARISYFPLHEQRHTLSA